MKVSLSGLSEYADTLHIDLPRRLDWNTLTSLLMIDGTQYFLVQACTVFVRYSAAVDVQDIAAQTLRVIAEKLDTPIEELSIGIHDSFVPKDKAQELVNDIRLRALAASTPEDVHEDLVVPRGTAPAYYLA